MLGDWRRVRVAFVAMVVAATALVAVEVGAPPAGAAATGVVLTEVMYHAPADATGEDDAYDFIELQNLSAAPIDLTGWRITEAVEFRFPSLALEAGARLVVAADSVSFVARYGVATPFHFADGKLKNSSETVRLVDPAGALVDALTYRDVAPWPGAGDGGGSSLEKVVLDRADANDDSDATNWLASFATDGTPGAVNSVAGLASGPQVLSVGHGATRPQPAAPVRVDLAVTNATNASLRYRVMFGSLVTVPMSDGVDSAGGAGDGTWSAVIPGQAAGSLVRYRATAVGPGGTTTTPLQSDTIDDHGYVVDTPALATSLPLIEWFMEDPVYNDMLARHRYDDVSAPAIVSYGGQIWDNARMRVRGATSRSFDKPSFNVELPAGHSFTMPGIAAPVDEFNLQWHQTPDLRVAWEVSNAAGFPQLDYFQVRTNRNGAFWGSGGYLTALDGRWRDEHGYGDASFYKKAEDGQRFAKKSTSAAVGAEFEKKEGDDDDFTDIWQLAQALDAPTSPAQKDFILDRMDLANVVNYMAFLTLTGHFDTTYHNYYLSRDAGGTDRWSVLPWDYDVIMRLPSDGKPDMLLPNNTIVTKAVLDQPEFKAMFARRVTTLVDRFMPSYFLDRFDELYYPMRADWLADYQLWGQGAPPDSKRTRWRNAVAARSALLASNTGAGRLYPKSQSSARPIVISEINYQPGGGAPEFVELSNTSTTEAFDLSGWRLDGVGLAIPAGTVLLPGHQVVFTSDDAALRVEASPIFIAGEFPGELDDGGETLRLLDAAGGLVDLVTYGSTAPWPWPTAGYGPSLELVNLTSDNSGAGAWARSSRVGGTPGQPNLPDTSPVGNPPSIGLVLNEYNAVAPANRLDLPGSDPVFGTSLGNGGDWFEAVVVGENMDLRGWSITWSDQASSGVINLTNQDLWRSLPRGTIVTFAESVPTDVSLNPAAGDWSINIQVDANVASAYVVPVAFDVTHDNWQVAFRDGSGHARFGPVGEGVGVLTGVSSREVGVLLDDPSESTSSSSNYDDTVASSFGMPNPRPNGVQNFRGAPFERAAAASAASAALRRPPSSRSSRRSRRCQWAAPHCSRSLRPVRVCHTAGVATRWTSRVRRTQR